MTYEKPAIVAVGNAAAAVKATGKDGKVGDAPHRTATAYEADE